ncbi:MAG TPA: carbon-nitrogen hydrolase family protein [Beijerinckiaceae bacterium]|nr:carbon-nitrogen hydrolase family protein [Beijerinckiaceae bacterium]
MKIALLQMNSVASVEANITQLTELTERAVAQERPDMIVPPEAWNWFGGGAKEKFANADETRGGRSYKAAQALARKHKIWVHAGSLSERNPNGKVNNVTYVFDREGREVARYCKIHMFDITAPDGSRYAESATAQPGREIVTYQAEGLTFGCAICYDLRFPELFQALAMRGAEVIVLPAAFTLQTGKDHWDVLIRARAIETETYMCAAGMTGPHTSDDGSTRFTYGHSLIADPWGHIICKASDGVGYTAGRIDKAFIKKCRQQIPVLEHKVVGTPQMPLRSAAE